MGRPVIDNGITSVGDGTSTASLQEELVSESPMHITIETTPASDGWGFVGRIMLADHEAYRTFQAFPTPSEALTFTQQLVGDMLGVFLAGQEWRQLSQDLGHSPLRQDLQFGLGTHRRGVDTSLDE